MMMEKEKEKFRKGIAEGKYMFHERCGKHGAYDRPMYDKDGFHQFHTIPICPKCEEEKMRAPEVADGWFYGVYIPGKWERLLDGPKLEAIVVKRNKLKLQAGQREMNLEAKYRASQPASEHFRQDALTNYGIG